VLRYAGPVDRHAWVLSDHPVELLIDLACAFAGLPRALRSGEWQVEVFAGMGDLAARTLDVGESLVVSLFEAVEAVSSRATRPAGSAARRPSADR